MDGHISWVHAGSFAAIVAVTGCQSVLGFQDFKGGGAAGAAGSGAGAGGVAGGGTGGSSAGSGGTTGGSGPGGSGGNPCDNPAAPSTTVPVRLSTGKCIWMDKTEVSAGDYQSFADGIASENPYNSTPCAWKTAVTDFQPGCGGASGDAGADAAAPDLKLPATCVDWCDARAYCSSKGEVLCGDPNDQAHSWWQEACRSGGPQYDFPYGSTYKPQACAGSDNGIYGCGSGLCKLAEVGSQPQCTTPAPAQINDLSGNAAEWVDECNGSTTKSDLCTIRGGSVQDNSSYLTCVSNPTNQRDYRSPFVGFRCCWTPP